MYHQVAQPIYKRVKYSEIHKDNMCHSNSIIKIKALNLQKTLTLSYGMRLPLATYKHLYSFLINFDLAGHFFVSNGD